MKLRRVLYGQIVTVIQIRFKSNGVTLFTKLFRYIYKSETVKLILRVLQN
jgi:hypothetical protein